MTWSPSLVLTIVVALAFAASDETSPEGVISLTGIDFDAQVKNGTEASWFVMFYAPWCGHCKRLTPDWELLAETLKGACNVAKVDATVEEDLSDRFEVDGYPTLKLIANGAVYDYEGERNVEAMVVFAKGGYTSSRNEQVDTSSEVIVLTSDNFDLVRSSASSPWFVEFYAPWCGHCKRLAPEWERLARAVNDEVQVAKLDATVEAEIASEWGVRSFPTLKLVASGKVYDYSGARTLEALQAYALGGYATTVGAALPEKRLQHALKLTGDNFYSSIMNDRGKPWFINFHLPSCGHCKSLAPDWESLAEQLEGEVRVVKVDASANRGLAKDWGVERFPTLKLLVDDKIYSYEEARDVDSMKAWAQGGYKEFPPERVLPDAPPPSRTPVALAFIGGLACALLALTACGAFRSSDAPEGFSQEEETSGGAKHDDSGTSSNTKKDDSEWEFVKSTGHKKEN